MPKTTWLGSRNPPPPPPPKVDYLGDMITRHMRDRKVTYARLAENIGLASDQSARCKKCRGIGKYQVDELFDWCKALGVDGNTLADAVRLAYETK